ncbi:PAS domain-containing protein [Enterovirga aerilata]|uniref:PAS domain-containing protein n=1 Tax=Enterovirga aerilata TaxID=2730920 RepID=A0A849IH69_9HYPH|nr:PAS domain-containing protein [Enterovirga sp. DB1703]NNM73263.1 PAS domain-containing protein [Enterovirga sp. DB1703]
MKHATSRLLFAYWDSLRGDRAAPERSQIEPGRIRHILADTFILGIDPEGRAHVRLAGTRVCALFGRDLKGVEFASLWLADRRAEPEQLIDLVVNDTVGVVAGMVGQSELGSVIGLELIVLPLRHHGAPNRRALGALSPSAVPSWLGLTPLDSFEMRSLRVIGNARPLAPGLAEFAATPATKRWPFVVLDGGLCS